MGDAQAPGSNPEVPLHHGEGKVERIDKDEITISHGPIATLQWGAMTMGFKVPAAGLPRNVGLGDRVAFDIKSRQDGVFEIVAISPIADAPAANDKGMGSMTKPKAPEGVKK